MTHTYFASLPKSIMHSASAAQTSVVLPDKLNLPFVKTMLNPPLVWSTAARAMLPHHHPFTLNQIAGRIALVAITLSPSV